MRAILTYHSIDASGSPISVTEASFRAHVRFLSGGRVQVLPLAELVERPDVSDAVAITFDDGFRSVAEFAAPLLADAGLPATVFLVADAVGGTNAWGGVEHPGIPTLPLMDWSQAAGVRSRGVEIGAHSRRHPDLTSLTPARLEDEMAGCVERILGELGERPRRFAYPYGRVNESVARVARDVFAHSCTTELRPLAVREDSALLPRLDAYYFRSPGQLESWGSPSFRRRLWLRAQGRRVRALVTPAAP